jgi:uncharacterized protein (TIGR02301 family)
MIALDVRSLKFIAFLSIALVIMSGASDAQGPGQQPPQPAEAPYDQQLLRLAEIIGALHYLRPLCGGDEETVWRDQMQALIDAENPDIQRRAKLVDRFNRGHDSFRSVYRSCTVTARLVVENYLEEGVKLSRELTARYGTGTEEAPEEQALPADQSPEDHGADG